jgi:yecA family protein
MRKTMHKKHIEQLESALAELRGAGCMGLEELDGFSTALFCIPEYVQPEEFLPIIFGGAFNTIDWDSEKAGTLVDLIMDYLEMKQSDCLRSEYNVRPRMRPDAQGVVSGQAWCDSFLQCLAHFGYMPPYAENEEENDPTTLFIPFLALAQGQIPADEDATTFTPLTPELRAELLQALPACTQGIALTLAEYFGDPDGDIQTASDKIPRNAPCPCGSGKKHKKCCMP